MPNESALSTAWRMSIECNRRSSEIWLLAPAFTEQRLADEATLQTQRGKIMVFDSVWDESKDKVRRRYRYFVDRITLFCEQLWHCKTQLSWRLKVSYLTLKIALFENWKGRSHFAKRRYHNAITHAWLRRCCLTCFQNLFGKEADKLEHANDDERICILLLTVILVGAFDYEAAIPGSGPENILYKQW